MPSEKFTTTLSDCRVQATSGKRGDKCISIVGFSAQTAEGISVTTHLSGPEEVMQKLLSGWPVNLNDPKATIAMKLPVEVGISTILIPSAGSAVNQIAASEAEKAEEAAKQAPETDALEALGKDVQKLQA